MEIGADVAVQTAVRQREQIAAIASGTTEPIPPLAPSPYQDMTIKQLIIRALGDRFSDGATPLELRTFISDAYEREIDRNSMAPQLSRLKEEGVVEQLQEGEKFKWKLRGVTEEDLKAIGHWPPQAKHQPPDNRRRACPALSFRCGNRSVSSEPK